MNQPILQAILIVLCISSFTPNAQRANAGDPDQPMSLDQQLLQGLTDESIDEAAKPQTPAKKKSAELDPKKLDETLDKQLLDELTDPSSADATDPLGKIGQKMRRAQGLINKHDSGKATQELQLEIVSDIDKLLDQARQKSQQTSSSSSRQQNSRREEASQPKNQPASAGGQGKPSNQPARDSNAQLQNRTPERPDPAATRDLIQELWGHLPERDRQRVINSTIENFIPKYEFLIKEYFKRLTESARQR